MAEHLPGTVSDKLYVAVRFPHNAFQNFSDLQNAYVALGAQVYNLTDYTLLVGM
ncbi:hypothetical protein MoryE10_05270 [Methylogaea oryzae]|uniref:Uncharacterized protein n=1 Tax=Methylogaea oryzae TaxID=1295382 RepID=A0A8D4VLR8_9GAMM|nr:hypothetical protein MoryE10_05270 [Methylogaea oryzae]